MEMFDREKQTIRKPDKSLTTIQACKIFTAAKLISVTFATQVCGALVWQHKKRIWVVVGGIFCLARQVPNNDTETYY